MSVFDYSPQQQAKMFLVGAVFVILGILYVFVRPVWYQHRHDQWAAYFENQLPSYTRHYEEFRHPGRIPPYVRGKVVVVDARTKEFNHLSFTLWPWLNPKHKDDVGTIVRVEHGAEYVGTYTDGMSAGRAVIRMQVIDLKYNVVAYEKEFRGSKPPASKKGPGSRSGSVPWGEVRWFLNTAGQIPMDAPGPLGAIIQGMRAERTVEAIDVDDPLPFQLDEGRFYRLTEQSTNVLVARNVRPALNRMPNVGDALAPGTMFRVIDTYRAGATPRAWKPWLEQSLAANSDIAFIEVLDSSGQSLYDAGVRNDNLKDNTAEVDRPPRYTEPLRPPTESEIARSPIESMLKKDLMYRILNYPVQIVVSDETAPGANGQRFEGQMLQPGQEFKYIRKFRAGYLPEALAERVAGTEAAKHDLVRIDLMEGETRQFSFAVYLEELEENIEAVVP